MHDFSTAFKDQIFRLPSHGVPYNGINDFRLIDGTSVKLKPFTAGVQRYFVAPEGQEYLGYVNVLSKIIVEPQISNFDAFLVTDLNACMFAAHYVSTYDPLTFPAFCTSCMQISVHEIKLDKAQMRDKNEIENYRSIGLECEISGNRKVSFHLPTLADEKKVQRFFSTTLQELGMASADEELDKSYIRTAAYIDGVNGAPMLGLVDKFNFVNDQITVTDFELINEAIANHDTGLKVRQVGQCTNKRKGDGEQCSGQNEIMMVITPQFFRATPKVPELVNRSATSVG